MKSTHTIYYVNITKPKKRIKIGIVATPPSPVCLVVDRIWLVVDAVVDDIVEFNMTSGPLAKYIFWFATSNPTYLMFSALTQVSN